MGPDFLNHQVQSLRSRAVRYRKIGALLGHAEISARLNRLAADLDDAIGKLEFARDSISATVENSHRLWAGLNLEHVIPILRAQEALSASSQIATAGDWRELSRLWLEEAESSKHHPDKDALAGRAFEIAQLAEKIAVGVESKYA